MSLEFIGKSKTSLKLLRQLEILQPKKVDVLLYGESGSGRDFCAQFLDSNLKKIESSFWSLEIQNLKHVENLYIDNIENLEPYAQLELLRLIETRTLPNQQQIKGRIFYSTTKQILKKIQSGEFREDLFQKIQSIRIEIPSLKEREEDILLFVYYFLKRLNDKYKKQIESVSKKLLETIQTHTWERNLSELELFLETQIVFSKKILELHSKPISVSKLSNLEIQIGLTLKDYEREIILANLKHFQGNRSKTAKALGISERNLYRKIQEYGLNLN